MSDPEHRVISSSRLRAIAVIAAVVSVSGLLLGAGALIASSSRDFGLEAAKAGFQLLILAVAGFGVTGAVSWFTQRQDERRRVNDAALLLLRDLIDNYNRLKATRRFLRALGLQRPTPGTRLSAQQAQEFERQMRTLVEVQLCFERIGREIGVRVEEVQDAREGRPDTHRGPPAPDLSVPQHLLTKMEAYVGEIADEWADHGAELAAASYDVQRIATLPRLSAFLTHSNEDPDRQFRVSTSEPLRQLETYFRKKLLIPMLLKDEQ